MARYLHPTYLGRRTVAHNSSFGCPFSCSFCAVVAMTNRRWLAQSPARIERVAPRTWSQRYRVDAVQMHDMDFFISEARVAEFAERIAPLGITWWALGRVDTLMQYSDATWRGDGALGAEDGVLRRRVRVGRHAHGDEQGRQGRRRSWPLELARRMRATASCPSSRSCSALRPIRSATWPRRSSSSARIKRVNPATEIILYTYTPVPMDGTLYAEAAAPRVRVPATLDEWASDEWQQLMMRRGDGIPWIDGTVRRRVRNFERVLNAFYPTVTDRRLTPARRAVLKAASAWRYALKVYAAPVRAAGAAAPDALPAAGDDGVLNDGDSSRWFDVRRAVRCCRRARRYALWAETYPPRPHNPLMEAEQSVVGADARSAAAAPRALDVGTGTGRYLPLLQSAGARLVVGIDLSLAMLAHALPAARTRLRGRLPAAVSRRVVRPRLLVADGGRSSTGWPTGWRKPRACSRQADTSSTRTFIRRGARWAGAGRSRPRTAARSRCRTTRKPSTSISGARGHRPRGAAHPRAARRRPPCARRRRVPRRETRTVRRRTAAALAPLTSIASAPAGCAGGVDGGGGGEGRASSTRGC